VNQSLTQANPPVAPASGNNKDGDAGSQRPATVAGTEQSPDASSPAGSGQEEFDAAREILKGANRQRDLQTAVALLWSGVRKGYVPAEVTLADLYRRGEGVEKNCDQAQVLLVAASRKGSPDARRVLESMAEQGCQ
jgi:TPR repeat protein